MPWCPVSVAPKFSATINVGRCSLNCSLTASDRIAPAEPTYSTLERSRCKCRGNASAMGRAIASPTIVIVLTRSRSATSHTRSGSKRGISTILSPQLKPMKTASCAAPWISGAIGNCTICGSRASAFCATCSGFSTGSPSGLPPPIPVKNRSSWRHMTPLGMPVVPPV